MKQKRAAAVACTDLLADQIVATLFRIGEPNESDRLVLEMHDRSFGGGWCRSAVRSVIIKALESNDNLSHGPANNPKL